MSAEGWYADPFERHEARWFSAGRPSALVRDGDVEAQDPPPATAWTGELQRPPEDTATADGAGLTRAEEPARGTRAEDAATITGAGFS